MPICGCMNPHGNIVCDCGHGHEDHVFAAGCKLCQCNWYSQTQLRKRDIKEEES